MNPYATPHRWRVPLAWSAVFRAVGLSIAGFLGWLWVSSADGPASKVVSLVAVLAVAALISVAWYLRRVRTEGRWRAALDQYAEQQEAERADTPRQTPAVRAADAERHDTRGRDAELEDLAAKHTRAAAAVVLRRKLTGSWIEMELCLRRVLTETVKKWSWQRATARSQGGLETWQEGLLTELAERACSVAVEHGAGGSLSQIKAGLYLTFRSVVATARGRRDCSASWLDFSHHTTRST